MSSPTSPPLQIFRHLFSSPDFHDKLSNVLYGEEYVECVSRLQGEDLVWLIDYLDKALDRLDPFSPASRKCLRELRTICSTRVILPPSYAPPSQPLQIDSIPFASGGSGDVYKGTIDGSNVCIKRIRVYANDVLQTAAKAFCREAVTWKHLTHPNVLPLLGVTLTPFQLISSWVSGGNLLEYIRRHPDADRLGLLCNVVEGLHYLHSRGVIHGDLKGPNILVEDSGQVRIADFGLAKITRNLDSIRSASYQGGLSARWAAPELCNREECSKAADVFSFAMVAVETFTGAVPFSNYTSFKAMVVITQGERPPRPTHPNFTDMLWEMVQRCWVSDPHLRPEISEVLPALFIPNLPTDKRIQMITLTFSDRDEVEAVERLSRDDAQALIDVIDEVLDSLTPEIRRRCLHYLSRSCARHSLLPKSLLNPSGSSSKAITHKHGGFANMRKGQYDGQQVAVKILNDLRQNRGRFYEWITIWNTFHHPNVLPLLGVTMAKHRFTIVSRWMANGNINKFLKVRPAASRLELLADVIKGLIYLHDQGIVHGNLSGSNVLIDNNGHACLAGFNLLTIIPNELMITSSGSPKRASRFAGGTQWSAPEVLKGGALSKKTDIFSFAMVMIEVFSGTAPFSNTPSLVAMSAVTQGRRPQRPTHPGVTGGLWRLMQRCWDEDPSSRPEASEALQILLDCDLPARNPFPANEHVGPVPQPSSSAQPHTFWRMPPPERSHDPSLFSHHHLQPPERAIRTRRRHGERNGTSHAEPHRRPRTMQPGELDARSRYAPGRLQRAEVQGTR